MSALADYEAFGYTPFAELKDSVAQAVRLGRDEAEASGRSDVGFVVYKHWARAAADRFIARRESCR
jgi:hypothetical protein